MKGRLKAMRLRPMRLGESEVPLAQMPGAVASGLQCLGQRDGFRIEVAAALRQQKGLIG